MAEFFVTCDEILHALQSFAKKNDDLYDVDPDFVIDNYEEFR